MIIYRICIEFTKPIILVKNAVCYTKRNRVGKLFVYRLLLYHNAHYFATKPADFEASDFIVC